MSDSLNHDLFPGLRALVAAICVFWTAALPADPYVPPLPDHPEFLKLTSVDLPGGGSLLGGAVLRTVDATDDGSPGWRYYAFAVARLDAGGALDRGFGDGGIAAIPVWGYYEFVDSIALQLDGRIVAGGNAADPVGRAAGPQCYPAFCKHYPALIRLTADGRLDRSFNGSGKIMLSMGDVNPSFDTDFGSLGRIELDASGGIVVYDYNRRVAMARVNPDGTLDGSFVGAPPAPREIAFVEEQGLWSYSPRGSEPGGGVFVTRQGNTVFAMWVTYAHEGIPPWLVVAASRTAPGIYSGTLYAATGPALDAADFDPARVVGSPQGSAMFVFSADHTTFKYTIGGIERIRQLNRPVFGNAVVCVFGQPDYALAANYTDAWYAAPAGSQPGWGLSIDQQGEIVSIAWLAFDLNGNPMWLSGTGAKLPGSAHSYAGLLVQATGPWFIAGPNALDDEFGREAGTFTLTFADGNAGTFEYRVTLGDPPVAIERTRPITRQIFAEPGTRCS